MPLHLLAFAIPFFLVFIGLEYRYARKKGKRFFHFAESVANLNVGMAERLTDFFTTGAFYFLYKYIHAHYALFTIKGSVLTWVLLFLLTDLIWYWYHRFAHEINLFWAAHIVHHQSEDFNYTTSTRITIFQAGIRGSFWALLPLIGFPPGMIAVFLLVHGAYPFFTHTRAIGKLGWLEYIFVTPTHHGVHHASNPAYLDKNYGDILIIWDRFFGTFAEEKEEPVYGLTKPLKSYSFFWQHFHQFIELGVAVKRSGSIRKGLQIIFGKPDVLDPGIREILERKLLRRNRALLSRQLRHYIFFQTVVTLTLLFLLLLFSASFSKTELAIGGSFLLVSIVNTGALLEKQRWILYPELARFFLLLLFVNNYYFNVYVFTALSLMLLTVLAFSKTAGRKFCGLLYSR
jgi:alkylglycerol monooxygenase